MTRIRPHNAAHWPAVRVGVAVAAPLAVLLAVGHADWTGYAVFGSVSTVYSKSGDYRMRLHAQTGTGLALTVAVTLGVVAGVLAPGSMLAVAAMTVLSLLGYLLAATFGWLPVPSLFLVFAAGTTSAYPHAWSDVPIAAALSACAVLFGVLTGQLGRLLPTQRQEPLPQPPRTPLRHLPAPATARAEAAAYLLGPLVAGSAATIMGIGHPYWAAVSATVPLSGITLAAQLGRASLRLAGTILGLGVAFALLAAGPPRWLLVIAVAVLQITTELFVARNYGIAVISLTPLALILGRLAAPGPLPPLLTDRLVETILGVAVAIGALLAIRTPPSTHTEAVRHR